MRLRGKTQNRVALRAASGNLQVMPTDLAEKHAVYRLRKAGILKITQGGAHYWMPRDVKCTPKRDLLERLREGPLLTDDWQTVAASRKSLHVRIKNLRELGFEIEAEKIEDNQRHRGLVRYILREESAR